MVVLCLGLFVCVVFGVLCLRFLCLFVYFQIIFGREKKMSKVWFASSETYKNLNSIKRRMLNCQPQKTVFLQFRGHSSQRRFLEV